MATFILGFILGTLFGAFIISICVAASDADDKEDKFNEANRP